MSNSAIEYTASVYPTFPKKFFFSLFGLFLSFNLISQTTIAIQDFDLSTPAWNYSSDVAFFDNGTDGFFGVNSPFTPLEYVNLMDSVLYENDLDDEGDNGTTGFANVTFDPINVSAFNSVVLTFDYDIEGYNANDDEVHYEVFLDGAGQGQVTLQDGENPGDDAEGTVTENIPNGTTTVGLVISIRNNGTTGFSAYDNFLLEGVATGGGPEVVFALDAANVGEDVGTASVCVNLLNPGTADVMVDVVAVGGTATDPDDYSYMTQTVTFAAGDATPQCVSISIVDDAIIDEGETIELALQNAVGGAIGSTDTTIVTIVDNDKLTCTEPAWNVVSPIDNEEWSPITDGFEANGFCGGGCEQDVETWLIYGPLDMTGVGLLELAFTADEGFGITDLDVQYSNVAGANACPDEVAWTSVGLVTDSGDFTFDLSAATGTEVYIGIEYSDDGADGYSAWDLTDFALFADVCPTVGTFTIPDVNAGEDVIQCGIAPVMLNGVGDGVWSGGAGSFDDASSPTTTYTPAASEEGTTVVLTYTLNLAACTGFSDDVNLTFFTEPADTEFSYGAIDICPGSGILSVMHTTGVDGTYSVTMGDPTMIDLDPTNGDINLLNTSDGTYEITNTIAGDGNLILTGVIDATLTGGQPKAIELYALADIPDLSVYGVGSANNGNGGGVIEFTFPADAISAGSFIYVTASNTDFNTWFGMNADYVDDVANINGDDAIELYCNGALIDVFGDVNMDGSGEPWDYLDGWAYRVSNTGLNLGTFSDTDFTYSGINALDGESNNGTAATPFPIGTFTTDQLGICPNSVTSVTITIGDSEPPVVDCPQDIFVQLEPGECEEIVFYDITFTDNCGTIDAEMSQAINEMLVNDALDCLNNTSNHLRYFENNLPVPVEITQVNLGIFATGTNETVTVNVYSIPQGAAFVYANMTLQGTTDFMVPAGMNNSILPAMVEATIPVGMDYVLELRASNTTNFVIGYNDQGETGSTYIAGNNPVPC
ncbi:MAG: Calx-beta domain-containing protein, partial [Bacteroidota bacterium]